MQYPALSISLHTDTEAQWATITGSISTTTLFPGRPIPNPRMIIRFPFGQEENTYTFFIALHCGQAGDADFHRWLKTMLPGSAYYLCPGVGTGVICKKAKALRSWDFPFNRNDHRNCQRWLQMPKVSGKWSHLPTCANCTKLFSYLSKEARRKASDTLTCNKKRLSPSSNYPVSFLSPTSVTKRLTHARRKRFHLSMAVHKNSFNVNVGDATHDELTALVRSRSEVEKVLQEADREGQGENLRRTWRQDVEERLAFQKDQRKNGSTITINV